MPIGPLVTYPGVSTDTVDGTQRIQLSSYERAVNPTHYAESLRIDAKKEDAKALIAFRDQNGLSKAWLVAHDYLTYVSPGHGSNNRHKHFSIETAKADGSIHTRMEFPYGTDRIEIKTSDADFIVYEGIVRVAHDDAANAELRLGRKGTAGDEGATSTWKDRWAVRADNTADSGSNVGSDFKIVRYDDAGSALDNPVIIKRSNGNIGLLPGISITTAFGGGSGVIGIKNCATPPSSNPTTGGVLYVESGALKYRGSSGTVTVLGPA